MARILIVDDDLTIADLIKDVLSPLGHDCVLALSGAMAVDSVGKGRFDLVILDRNMPEMNGLQVLRAIRASPVGRRTPDSTSGNARHSATSSGPAARWIAPSTPPPPSSVSLAALTSASMRNAVISVSITSMRMQISRAVE